jgi:hypothetical protein
VPPVILVENFNLNHTSEQFFDKCKSSAARRFHSVGRSTLHFKTNIFGTAGLLHTKMGGGIEANPVIN